MPKKTTPSKYDPLPNIEAISALDKKTLLQSYHYLDILAEEHAIAFTVSKMMDKDLLTETNQAILDAMKNGTDFNDFKKRLKPYLMAKGWWGEQVMTDPKDGKAKKVQLGSTRRLRTIYHTNKHTAYAAGQWQRIQATKKTFPYLKYTPSVAGKQRKDHKKYYNLVLPVDHPIWKSIMPPNGWGCLCGVQQLTQAQAEAIGITEDFEAEWEEVINERTGKKVLVPKDIDMSFAHNHTERLDNLIQLAGEKHGEEFASDIQQQINGMADVLFATYEEAIESWVGYLFASYQKDFNTMKDVVEKHDLQFSEFMALRHYSNDGYTELNKTLRNYGNTDNEVSDRVALLMTTRAVLNYALDKMPVYNGVAVRWIALEKHHIDEYQIGEFAVFKAFTSSTYGKDVKIEPDANVRFIIHSKNGRIIESISVFDTEKEVLFPSPTSFMVLNKVDKDGYIEINLEEI